MQTKNEAIEILTAMVENSLKHKDQADIHINLSDNIITFEDAYGKSVMTFEKYVFKKNNKIAQMKET